MRQNFVRCKRALAAYSLNISWSMVSVNLSPVKSLALSNSERQFYVAFGCGVGKDVLSGNIVSQSVDSYVLDAGSVDIISLLLTWTVLPVEKINFRKNFGEFSPNTEGLFSKWPRKFKINFSPLASAISALAQHRFCCIHIFIDVPCQRFSAAMYNIHFIEKSLQTVSVHLRYKPIIHKLLINSLRERVSLSKRVRGITPVNCVFFCQTHEVRYSVKVVPGAMKLDKFSI